MEDNNKQKAGKDKKPIDKSVVDTEATGGHAHHDPLK